MMAMPAVLAGMSVEAVATLATCLVGFVVFVYLRWLSSSIDETTTLERSVQERIDRMNARGGGVGFDAALDTPSEDFKSLKEHTGCPFARHALVMNGAKWDPALSLEDNMKRNKDLLLLFNKRVSEGVPLDGFVIEIPDRAYGEPLEVFADTVRRALTAIWEVDPQHDPARNFAVELRSSIWSMSFDGPENAYFVSTFAPCYPSNSSRYNYGSASSFILFQPEISFQQKAVQLDSDPQSVRHAVRKRFVSKGQPYDYRDRKMYTMANWIVRPLRFGDAPVEWWREPGEGPLHNPEGYVPPESPSNQHMAIAAAKQAKR